MRRFLTAIILLITVNAYGQNHSLTSYLSTHQTDLTDDSVKDDIVFDTHFYTNQLFLAGEIHGIQKGQNIDFTLLSLLNKKVNIKTYIAEFDFSKAYLLNQYLKTGDERIIDTVFADWTAQDMQWGNKDFQAKIRKIRAYNATIPADHRIHFEGIDQIQNPVLAARYFREKLMTTYFKTVKNSFKPVINALELKNDSLIISTATHLKNELKKNKHFDSPAPETEELFFALENCISINKPREATMTANFKALFNLKNWKNEKLYGFFGFGHILLSEANDGKSVSLAYRLENDSSLPLKGKIASIALLYLDSKMTTPTTALPTEWQQKGKRFTSFGQFNHDGPLVRFDGIEDFKAVTKPNTLTAFNLSATSSPYLHKSSDIHYDEAMPASQRIYLNEKGKFITDYFQYVILVRNSAPTNPIII